MSVLSQILQTRIVAILRGAPPEDVLEIANALYKGGIKAVEITMNSPKALQAIELVADKLGNDLLIGAGTVLDAETARAAILTGARFIISPSLDIATIHMTRTYGAVSIPGAYTATEILTAYKSGGDIIKVFPATSPQYIKELRGPLAQIPLMPTGGLHLDNIPDYHAAGAVAFGMGSALVDGKQPITEAYLQQLTQTARNYMQVVTNLQA